VDHGPGFVKVEVACGVAAVLKAASDIRVVNIDDILVKICIESMKFWEKRSPSKKT
jgi:hypothetical protein